MKKNKQSFGQLLFGEDKDIEQVLLHVVLLASIIMGIVSLIISQFLSMTWKGNLAVILTILTGCFCLWLSVKKRRKGLAAMTTAFVVSVVLFPLMYFFNGGILSGMPIWLMLALVLDWLILDGRKLYSMYIVNVLVVVGTILLEQYRPDFVIQIPTKTGQMIDVIQTLVIISCVIGIVFKFQRNLYERQRRSMEKKDEELRKTMSDLNRANHAKSDFLANMSHEIRTPINAVLGMNEMILRENKQKNIADYARNIQSASQTLLALINDILDFSKIESGKMEIVEDKYDLFVLLKDSYNMISMRARDKNLKMEIENDDRIPYRLYGDEIRVRQILFNILTNAVKYTKEGKVTLRVNFEKIEKDRMNLILSVTDTGIGISEENQKTLFESFERFEEKKNRHIEGTGLGLSITRQLLDLMDGSITVESEYGVGSTFTVEVPQTVLSDVPMGNFYERYKVEESKVKSEKKKDMLEAPEAQLLVVDDMPMNLDVVVALLKHTKIHIERASSGEECLRKVAKKKYHVILMDHMMPEMDGVETLHRMKQMVDCPNQNTPIIVMTANAVVGAKEEYMKEGFDDYLSKPVKGQDLEATVWKHMPKNLIHRKSMTESASGKNKELDDDKVIEALSDFLDTDTGIMYCGGAMDFYHEILQSYIGNSNLTKKLKKCFDEEDWENYRTYIHALKSSSLSIGAIELSEKAKALELATQERDIAYIEDHHIEAMQEYREILDRLNRVLLEQSDSTTVQPQNGEDSRSHLLILEGDMIHTESLRNKMEPQFRITYSSDYEAAMETVKNDLPDLILLDMELPEMEGFELLHKMKKANGFYDIPIIFESETDAREKQLSAFKAGAADFVKKTLEPEILIGRISRILDLRHLQKNLEQEVESQTIKAHKRRDKLERLSRQTMMTLAATIDAKDKYTNGHSRRVAEYARMIGERAGKSKKEQSKIYFMGLLHDIGMIGIPDEIISLENLSEEDEKIMRRHTEAGADILQWIVEMPELQDAARYHHEWYDGSGYPHGLKGTEIPEFARIVSMADAYDAMTCDRLYRNVLTQEQIKEEIREGRGTQFDPQFADIMLEIIEEDKDYTLRGDI